MLAVCWLLIVPMVAAAEPVRVHVDLAPLFQLGDALENGVSLTLRRERILLTTGRGSTIRGPDKHESTLPQRADWRHFRHGETLLRETRDELRLGYSSLARAYVLYRPDREPEYFSGLVFALLAAERWLERIDPEWLETEDDGEQTLRVRVWLDRSALPLPLQWSSTIRGLNRLGGESGDAWQTHRLH